MKAISIKQPWASLICTPRKDNPNLGIKDIENRTWKTNFRGRIYIHAAAKSWTWQAVKNYLSDNAILIINKFGFDSEWLKYLHTSAIIGEVDIIDCVINHSSDWAEETFYPIDETEGYPNQVKQIYNWVLANPVLYKEPILNVKGKLSFWEFNK